MSRKHSPLAPSSVKRWTECSASVGLSASADALGLAPETEDDNSFRREGQVAMAILERMLPGPGGEPGAEYTDALVLASLDGDIDVTEAQPDMKDALEYAARALAPIIAGADTHEVEAALHIPQVPTYGHADFYAVTLAEGREHITVADYKHGVGVYVNAEENGQLMLYAAGVAAKHNLVRLDIPVTLIIIQPRHAAGGVKMWHTTLGHVFGYATTAGDKAREFSYKTGDHCQFCPAAPICGLRIKELERLATYNAEVVVHDKVGDTMAGVLDLEPRTRDLLARTKRAAIARLIGNRQIPGYAITEGPGRMVWKRDAETALRSAYGDRAYVTEALSPAQVRDTLPNGRDFVQQHAFRRPGNPLLQRKDTQ